MNEIELSEKNNTTVLFSLIEVSSGILTIHSHSYLELGATIGARWRRDIFEMRVLKSIPVADGYIYRLCLLEGMGIQFHNLANNFLVQDGVKLRPQRFKCPHLTAVASTFGLPDKFIFNAADISRTGLLICPVKGIPPYNRETLLELKINSKDFLGKVVRLDNGNNSKEIQGFGVQLIEFEEDDHMIWSKIVSEAEMAYINKYRPVNVAQ